MEDEDELDDRDELDDEDENEVEETSEGFSLTVVGSTAQELIQNFIRMLQQLFNL